MVQAFCGFVILGLRVPRPRWVCGLRMAGVAEGTVPVSAEDVVPAAGTVIMVCRRNLFSEDGETFLPAVQGAWGTSIVGAPAAWGTVITAQRAKDAPLKEEEDAFGKLYKAGLGDERQRLSVECVLRLGASVSTGDTFTMLGVLWFVAAVQEVWSIAEWAGLSVTLARWPTLKQRPAFGFAAI